MAKQRVQFVCQECGHATPKWVGRCPDCGEWNTMEQVVTETSRSARRRPAAPRSTPQRLTDVSADHFQRLPVSIVEFSRVLGGGVVPGSMVLIGGDPGIGKSTLLLQVSAQMAANGRPVLYVSGEESPQQIRMRADRLSLTADDLFLLAETNLDRVMEHVYDLHPHAVVIDSIQTVYTDDLDSTAGSITQVRECASRLMELAKSEGVPVFVVGHVTKEGNIAGPRVLEHIVDAVLYLEGERFHSYRLLRGVKNRFGSTNEVGVFEMTRHGLVEVTNPSEAFLAERLTAVPGSTVAVTLEGTRPLLVEVQALTGPTSFSTPRRTANGVDFNRLLLLTAVLSKRVGLPLGDQDVFVNIVGGLKIAEPAADLSIATAIASSQQGIPVASDLAIIGEIGLSGELRSVTQVEKRINEAGKLGFKRVLLSRSHRNGDGHSDVQLIPARTLGEALDVALAT
ncbi:MAG: DNA repair protein RadA [Anaerolineae bacterium]